MAQQIFVIGKNRSGTKWLSNIIANHRDVVAIQRDGAGGILESNLLRTYPFVFNLSNIEDRSAFEILFRESNFHKHGNVSEYYLQNIEYKSFYDFFRSYMDKVASDEGTNYWVQKAGSMELPILLSQFIDANFIIIQRKNILDNVISTILLFTDKILLKSIIKYTLDYWRHYKTETKYKNLKNVKIIRYEELKANSSIVIKDVCKFIGLPFYLEMLDTKYLPNTSYIKNDKIKYLTKITKFKINFFSFLFSLFPLKLINFFSVIYKCSKKFPSKFIPLSFEEYRINSTFNTNNSNP